MQRSGRRPAVGLSLFSGLRDAPSSLFPFEHGLCSDCTALFVQICLPGAVKLRSNLFLRTFWLAGSVVLPISVGRAGRFRRFQPPDRPYFAGKSPFATLRPTPASWAAGVADVPLKCGSRVRLNGAAFTNVLRMDCRRHVLSRCTENVDLGR